MKKWIKVSFSKKVHKDYIIHKNISCPTDDFDFESLKDDINYYDTTEIKISFVA